MAKPEYKEPSDEMVERSLDAAARFASFRHPEVVPLETRRIVPRENIVLEGDLVELMRNSPETVPPVVVAPWGDVHVVVDGHHRLAAAMEAGHKRIWAVEVDLVKLKNLEWPAWY